MKATLAAMCLLATFPSCAHDLQANSIHQYTKYECGGVTVFASLEPSMGYLIINHFTYVLPQVRATSGVHYQNEIISFSREGRDAKLSYKGGNQLDCMIAEERVVTKAGFVPEHLSS